MSISIKPIATVSGLERAMDFSDTSVQINAKYIGVGSGQQPIVIDSHGRAVTDTMKTPVAWVEILGAEKITSTQTRMFIDMAGIKDTAWRFAECVLADENKQAIAIHGHSSQALMTIDPVLDTSILAINMTLGTLPAESINIIHQGVTLELLNAKDMLAVFNGFATMAVSSVKKHLFWLDEAEAYAIEMAAEDKLRADAKALQQSAIDAQADQIEFLEDGLGVVLQKLESLELFEASTFKALMGLGGTVVKHKLEFSE